MHEGETQEVIQVIPDYCIIPGYDSQESLSSVSPAEIQLLLDMLSHFFLAKMETEIGASIKDRLDYLCKPKAPLSGQTQNKRHVMEVSVPTKIKKSLQKVTALCFEAMKANKDDWFTFAEAKALAKRLPQFLDYRKKIKQRDLFQDLEVDDHSIENEVIREGFTKATGVSKIPLQGEILELLHQLLASHKSCKAIFADYIFSGGDTIEIERFKDFLRLSQEVRDSLDRSPVFKSRLSSDSKLNMNGVAILMTLFMYFYDQEKSGSLLIEGANLAAENIEKISEISQSLSLYESVGRLSLACSSLMESPIWFFHNQVYQLKVLPFY